MKKKEKQVKNPMLECNHALAVHEGHCLLYARSGKYGREKLTKKNAEDNCCGGVSLFNYCPFCGKYVRNLIENTLK